MKRQNIYKQIALSLLLLVGMAGTAWGQVKENKYTPQWSISVDKSGKDNNSNPAAIFDNDDETWWSAANGQTGPVSIILRLEEDITFNGLNIKRSGNPLERAEKIEIYTLTEDNDSWDVQYTEDNIDRGDQNQDDRELTISLENEITAKYIKLVFTPAEGQIMAINEVRFVNEGETVQPKFKLAEIQHKHAKWHDQRGSSDYDDDFDNTKMFDTDETWRPESVQNRKIQATHTYIDTIYVHRGSSVDLTLPDYLNNDISIQSYQRWYSFRTGETFATENIENQIYDLLTPARNDFYYRLANGYVGSPLTTWNTNTHGGNICTMKFYFPTDEEFKSLFPSYVENDKSTVDNDWYVVACDVSGYTDYTKTFEEGNTNSTFTDGYYEPTLSHRVIFYIHAVEDEDSWYYKNWKDTSNPYLEEYEINMPFTRLPDTHKDQNMSQDLPIYEMVALSKDAQSYVSPDENKNEEVTLKVSIPDETNTAGIALKTTELKGTARVIEFDYPENTTAYGTKTVNQPKDGSIPSAEIIVKNGDHNVARFVLKFIKGTSLMTQTMIKNLNDYPDNASTSDLTEDDWEAYHERTPQYMNENYEFLVGLDFNFDELSVSDRQDVYYPYPLAWDHCSYAFYDGSGEGYFKGSTFPQWGYYSIMNNYLECADPNSSTDTWGWSGHTQAKTPPTYSMEPRVEGEEDTYHMFIDASDRPGIIARLPFESDLCDGTELFVSAWVKSAKWNAQTTNAAMLFTFMGVTDKGEYVPLYRHQTGQIPATYMSDIKLPGFGTDNNEWFQIAFSFVTQPEMKSLYKRGYVLQIENNSASTSGGDMYLDDVRVYMARPRAEIKQLEATCGNERTRLNFSMDWERLISRNGEPDLNPDSNGSYQYDQNYYGSFPTENEVPYSAIGLCFIDKWAYEECEINSNSSDEEIAEAIKQTATWIGANDGNGENNYQFAAMFYKLDFDKNTSYEDEKKYNEGALAKNNKWFFYYDEDEENRRLTVDFLAAIKPYRPYIMMVVPVELNPNGGNTIETIRESITANSFTGINDQCAITTEVWVTSESLIMVNGEVLDPDEDYCVGQVRNFSVQLRAPNGINEEGEQQYIDINEGVYFDWFFGDDEEFGIGEEQPTDLTLADALKGLRMVNKEATTIDEIQDIEPTTDFTQEMKDLIKGYMEDQEEGSNPRLVLHKENLNVTLLEDGLDLVVRPIETDLTTVAGDVSICWNPLYFHLKPSGKAPELHVGFHDVTYPTDIEPNLRIGLKQIQDANGTNPIKVNLRGAGPVTSNATKLVKQEGNDYIYLIGTNDPSIDLDNKVEDFDKAYPVGKIVNLTASKEGSENDYMTIYFDTDLTKAENNDFVFNPREGYEYLLRIPFQEEGQNEDSEPEGTTSICYGTFNLTMKVVPEYQKWIGEATDNWNNDDNWARSSSTELKKADDSYTDYNNDDLLDSRMPGYVPMKFTNVTIPENGKVELYDVEENSTTSGNTHKILNLTTEKVNQATTNIEYDMLVNPKIQGTEGSQYYECETYYTNTVDQIHFEPNAEMLHAELLQYEKAWVDYKLESGKWHTLASPLQGVVAGDFYTDSETGTEEQEYFTDITFDGKIDNQESTANKANETNSRFSPSVYQRGWDKSEDGAHMITTDSESSTRAIQGNWSAVYNNVYEEYKPGEGFSVKALDFTNDDNAAIFRLPKADPSYSYYTIGDNGEPTVSNVSNDENSMPESRTNAGKLQITPSDDATEDTESLHTVTLSGDNDYYLIGNPFMAHLDAKAFFDGNSDLARTYWFEDDGVQNIVSESNSEWISTLENKTIPPLRSFFVKKAENAADPVTVTFKKDMQVLGETTDGDTNTNALILTAKTADGKISRAAVAYDMSANKDYAADEDAELFLDSNLSDVPAIYTVAGTMATSINRTSELYNIPVGIYGYSTEMVTLSFEGLKHFSSATLYDAEKKTETPLREGTTLIVPASTSGRYFLRAGTPTGNEILEADDIQIYTLSGNRVMVTSATPLKDIRVYNLGGALTKHVKAGVCSFELYLPDGIYIVTAENANGEVETEKVSVR